MSSPPMEFPDSDARDEDTEMQDAATGADSYPEAPPRNRPLFLPGTPSAAGSPGPRNLNDVNASSSPFRGLLARRAVGLVTPRRNGDPLTAASSSPLKNIQAHFSSDDPRSGRSARVESDPLEFPVTPVAQTPVRNRRGDIHSSVRITPASLPRTPRRNQQQGTSHRGSDALSIPASSAPDLSAAPLETDEADEIRAIWGTTVNLGETMKLFKDFLRGFKPKYRALYDRKNGIPTRQLSMEDSELVLYESYMRIMRRTNQTNLNLDMINLLAYPPSTKLYSQLEKYPQEVVPAMDQVLKDMMLEVAEMDQQAGMDGMRGDDGEEEIADMISKVYKIRPYGQKAVNMRELNPADTDKLVCIKGLVIRATPVIPDMKVAFFRCLTCSHTVQVEIDRGKIDEPQHCPRDVCASVGTMNLVHNRSEFADRQIVRMQETPDAVPDGQTPHTVSLSVYDELVDVSKPGDRLVVTGIFRSVPVRVNPRQRTIKSLFKTFLDVLHVRRMSGGLGVDKSTRAPGGRDSIPGVGGSGLGGDDENEEMYDQIGNSEKSSDEARQTRSAELEAKLIALSQRPDIYDLLARSLAPSIWEMDNEKKGILLQLFGGTNKTISRGGGGGGPRYRGDINVLLVGDPGTAKSQILQYVHKIAPRGVYTSGKGSSAVGLTAYVTRDPDSKQLVLESGALVLSDGGVCCIDEFDKMSDATRSVLHEVMEQQTVSVAKAGIITTLNARTSILAAANPVGSRYNVNWPITRNIDLPPTLISRFDLLYLVLDQVDEGLDRRMAQHLVNLYLEDRPATGGTDILPLEDLSAYISYARSRIHPALTEAASSELVKSYVELRNVGVDPRSSERRITATTRQLESMIRLSEAHARMRFSGFVELVDVKEAVRLMREAIRTSATDPTTGLIDLDLINTGAGQQQRRMRGDLRKELMNLLQSGGTRGVRWTDAAKRLNEQSNVAVDAAEFTEVIRALESESIVKVVGEKDKRTIRLVEGA